VRTEPNRGTYVTEFTSDEMYEMLELRLAVERIALRRILDRRMPKPDIASYFAEVLNVMRRAATLKDRLAYCQADLSFHNRIIDLSFSPVLGPTWQLLSRGVLVFLMQEQHGVFDFDRSVGEHERLLTLIQGGKRDMLEAEIEGHILNRVRRQRKAHRTRAEGDSANEQHTKRPA
jgi:DNA-binding GntR family transcriptional regulator